MFGSKHRDGGGSEGKFASVLDLCHCTSSSRGESSVNPESEAAVSGRSMGDYNVNLCAAQGEALKRLRSALQEESLLRERDTDHDLLRFLKARSFDVAKAKAMYQAMLQWRKEVAADTIIQTFNFPEQRVMKELYPHFHHKTDKLGRPVYIERLGKLQLDELLKVTKMERMLLYHIKEWEILIDWKFPPCSKKAGRTINQSLTILDLKGVTMKHMSKQVRHFIQKISRVDQDYYPEYLGKMIIINTPTTFMAIWAMIKPWLDKRTQKKIEVLGSNFTHKLLELVDSENLPEFLGGSCRCTGGCELSDAGPWNDDSFHPFSFHDPTFHHC